MSETTTNEQNTATVRRVFEDIWNEKRRDLIDELFSEDLRSHGFGTEDGDLDTYKQHYDAITTAFPDITFDMEAVFSGEGMTGTIWTATGTHEGELMGVEAIPELVPADD